MLLHSNPMCDFVKSRRGEAPKQNEINTSCSGSDGLSCFRKYKEGEEMYFQITVQGNDMNYEWSFLLRTFLYMFSQT